MSKLFGLSEKIKSIKPIKILKEVLNEPKIKQFIISRNTHDQLFDKGEDSRGVELSSIGGGYSRNTIEGTKLYPGKKELGLPYDRVTLFQTGEFYESWSVKIDLPDIIFKADDQKEGVRLNEEWGGHILGLNDENKKELEEILLSKVVERIFSMLLS